MCHLCAFSGFFFIELIFFLSLRHCWSGFVELSLVDQIHLLKCCWLEILMLGLMWRSVDHPGKLIFSPDFKLNRWAVFHIFPFTSRHQQLSAELTRVTRYSPFLHFGAGNYAGSLMYSSTVVSSSFNKIYHHYDVHDLTRQTNPPNVQSHDQRGVTGLCIC